MTPLEEYQSRLARWQSEFAENDRRFRLIGNVRLAAGAAAVVIAALSLGAGWISAWWLLAPAAVMGGLGIVHVRAERQRACSIRATAYYDRALARLQNRWQGKGRQGENFRDPRHLYADDLDLFGAGSVFERISTARTSVGERILASWLLSPSDPETVRERQIAVAELRNKLDLREELTLMGEEVRAAIEDRVVAEWGNAKPVRFIPGGRWIALALAILAVVSLGLFFAQVLPAAILLSVFLLEMIFGMACRDAVMRVVTAVSTPAAELRLLGHLLERLERESFDSAHLREITRRLDAHGLTPSAEIRRLERLVNQLDSARNQFFRLLAAPLLWVTQFAMAIEDWRRESGPHIGEWIAAAGEFEALCSLASFAYEREDAIFPELAGDGPLFDAVAIRHPLIDPQTAVSNDVRLSRGDCSLWVVSGSNMSGKSTLLRAVGVNAVLAWAGAPVTCEKLRVSPLRIGASIRVNDSLVDNRSRFYAEITRLREIADLSRAGEPVLFLLDELLSGTNSHDRRIGAAALVRGLVERGAIGLVTTHDLALADVARDLGARARNVHFEDHIEGGEMHFDYRLKPGVVERSNALELMRAVGLDV
jgi:hypothetical protein